MFYDLIARVGWLTDLTNWLLQQIKDVWDAFMAFMSDLFYVWFEHQLQVLTAVFALLPVPDFLNGSNLQSLFGSGGPTIGWLIATFQIDRCMGIVSAACVFYVVRRFLTLGIW